MKQLIDTAAHVISTERLIPANLAVLGVTTMHIDMTLKVSLTVLMIVLTTIKIYKELKNKEEK